MATRLEGIFPLRYLILACVIHSNIIIFIHFRNQVAYSSLYKFLISWNVMHCSKISPFCAYLT